MAKHAERPPRTLRFGLLFCFVTVYLGCMVYFVSRQFLPEEQTEPATVATTAPVEAAPEPAPIKSSPEATDSEIVNRPRRANPTRIFSAITFASISVLALVAAAFLYWKAAKQLVVAQVPTDSPAPDETPATTKEEEIQPAPAKVPVWAAFPDFDSVPATTEPAAIEALTARFMAAIERLEQRMQAMENALLAKPPANGSVKTQTPTPPTPAVAAPPPAPAAPAGVAEKVADITLLLGKGQTLLKLGNPEEALGCFDEVLAMDAGNTDALVKKGTALERLQRLSEAIDCYDRAIARNNTMTIAYLYKGGVYNRLERYTEALECYEQALKTQRKSSPEIRVK